MLKMTVADVDRLRYYVGKLNLLAYVMIFQKNLKKCFLDFLSDLLTIIHNLLTIIKLVTLRSVALH